MLKLVDITKDYTGMGQPVVHALKGLTVNFRRNEFVAILGQSGCGKTTLLNIIGGLDRYTNGDLIIEGKSTKDYKDRDWNTYRNHSIGFIFQSYNLITHISVLENVELALTISGISHAERKARALEALKTVGLEGKERKKPNQLSGGQMQRVAIARALVNDPEILLADEPTGALDSETSIQVMDLLKEVAKDRLVIMVTHNPDLAYQYANRIIKMSDGLLVDDSNPYSGESEKEREIAINKKQYSKGHKKKTSMSFFTALGLSFKNMMTKKGRTFLTAFAGSIGIIGIALILSVSYGMNKYVNRVQQDALTSYPMTVSKSTIDTTSLVTSLMAGGSSGTKYPSGNVISADNSISNLVNNIVSSSGQNDTKSFKEYLDNSPNIEKYKDALTSIQYRYNVAMNAYLEKEDGSISHTYPAQLTTDDSYVVGKDEYKLENYFTTETEKMLYNAILKASRLTIQSTVGSSLIPTFAELIPSMEENGSYSSVLDSQYDVLYGRMPKYDENQPSSKYEMVLIVDAYNKIDEYLLYGLGLKSPTIMAEQIMLGIAKNGKQSLINQGVSSKAIDDFVNKLNNRVRYEKEYDDNNKFSITFEEMTNLKYYFPLSYQVYEPVIVGGKTSYFKETEDKNKIKSWDKIKIVGVVRPKQGTTSTSLTGALGYLPQLGDYMLKETNAFDDINDCFEYNEQTKKYDFIEGSTYYPSEYDSPSTNVLLNQIYNYRNPTRSEQQLTVSFLNSDGTSKYSGSLTSFESAQDPSEPFLGTWRGLVFDTKTKIDATIALTIKSDNTVSILIDGVEEVSGIWTKNGSSIIVGALSDTTPFVFSYSYVNAYISSLTGQICNASNSETVEGLLTLFGYNDPNTPSTIRFYPVSFAAKERIRELVNEYNSIKEDEIYHQHYEGYVGPYTFEDWVKLIGKKDANIQNEIGQAKITVNDTVGSLMSSVQTIIDGVSYVLIAFVSISLVVSSIMIGIITYVSVLERTKEIGVLRSIGARKIDIANVFNAETVITGLAAGILGVGIALLIDIPLGMIVNTLSGLTLNIIVPWYGIIFLPIISVVLTVVSGLIPSTAASRKDPVIALRTE